MLRTSLVIARKEILDHARDGRALMSSGLYALMGPAVTALVVVAAHDRAPGSSRVMAAMASAFAVMAAFTGALTLTTDTIAGERERRSFLPLLLNPVTRLDIVVGKWLAAIVFAAAAMTVNVAAFDIVVTRSASLGTVMDITVLVTIGAMLPLVALATAGELLVATSCRTVKEANSYLSMLTFLVMGATMWVAVKPGPPGAAASLLPISGHERLLERGFAHAAISSSAALLLSAGTLSAAVAIVLAAARMLRRDSSVYGG